MSYADEIFQQNCRDILQNGIWDTDQQVRPRWDDGAPAHTITATSGISGQMKTAPSAKLTVISWPSGTSTPRANLTRWTG